jgi:hypothetical protein
MRVEERRRNCKSEEGGEENRGCEGRKKRRREGENVRMR